jgi:16S rRNA G966 N2-methylase RsmD/predicted RNA-binding Zn-ribbon protein involved in translation (DUF1610 family)
VGSLSVSPQLVLLREGGNATKASRSDGVYGTHAYHTKVPPAVAAAYIERNCPPDGIVLDPFCGSGMTGLGALMVGRRARLSDLSPAAVHIASNYTSPCDPKAFERAVARVLERVGGELDAMYRSEANGSPATIEYVVWSDVRVCPDCSHEVVLWEVREAGLRSVVCPRCGHEGPKRTFRYVGERPVQTSLSSPTASKRIIRESVPGDVAHSIDIPAERWYPTDPFDPSRPMWRRSHGEMAIDSVDRFFSRRNLAALAALWSAVAAEPDERVRSALRFSLTAIVNRASRRYQWNAKRPTNVLGGTLYVSSLRYEWNVMSLWRRKVAAVRRLLSDGPAVPEAVEVIRESATALSIKDASIDYCFCDPPFGAHIVYSDVSLLWEAWLGELTDREQEAIVVSSGDRPKGVHEYQDLLEGSFAEIRRVLKSDGRVTVVFQATDEAVWAAIMHAAEDAGLFVADASTLHKGQPSFKQIKGTQEGERVAHTDVVLTFGKVGAGNRQRDAPDVRQIIAEEISATTAVGDKVNVGHIYAVVAAAQLVAQRQPLSFDAVADLVADCGEPLLALH